jgi:hypothetical protein
MTKFRGFDPNREESVRKWNESKYPRFIFKRENADLEFFKLVQKATKNFNFNDLPEGIRYVYKESKKSGFESVFRSLKETFRNDPSSFEKLNIRLALTIGEMVFGKLPKDEIEKYLPFNDFRFIPQENEIIVQCRALTRIRAGRGEMYHSRLRPTVEIDGSTYFVAFSKHAIHQICNRVHPFWMNYSGLGDVYAYLEENIYFEFCELLDGSPAITFWDICGTKSFWHYLYVKQVLGEENLIPGQGQPYFRVGYCPIAFEGEFINAKTLLLPGYSKTPEYSYIQNSTLSHAEKRSLRDKITQRQFKSEVQPLGGCQEGPTGIF